MNADASGIKFPEVIPYPMQGLDRLAVDHLHHLAAADERDPRGQGLAVLLVPDPDQITGLQRGIGELDAGCHAVCAVHQERDGAVVDGGPAALGLPSDDASERREPGGPPLGLALYPCLLYTSPSPRDLSTSRMPSSA